MLNLIGRILLKAVIKLFFNKTVRYIVVGDGESPTYERSKEKAFKVNKETDFHDYPHPN